MLPLAMNESFRKNLKDVGHDVDLQRGSGKHCSPGGAQGFKTTENEGPSTRGTSVEIHRAVSGFRSRFSSTS